MCYCNCNFSAVQCLISRTQVKQDLRLKRLELAQKLDEQFIHFPYEREKCKIMLDWLMSNRSLFMFFCLIKMIMKNFGN